MGWVIAGLIVALIATKVLVSAREYTQVVHDRTRRHLEDGGKLTDAPDTVPPHGGGS